MIIQRPVYIDANSQALDGIFGKILKIGSLGLIGGKKKPKAAELDAIAQTTADQIAAQQVLAAQQAKQRNMMILAGAGGLGLVMLLMKDKPRGK